MERWKTMTEKLLRLRDELGVPGLAALAFIALIALTNCLVVAPLQTRSVELQMRSAAATPAAQSGSVGGSTDHKIGAVYDFLGKSDQATDWLAKLHGIGVATGLQMKSASYRTREAEGRIVRYEIVLPVTGSYAQIRDFLKRSLAEVPVMSIDQLALKRETRKDGALQAELRLTLHMVKS
jgi:hypothetical protein